jgi:RimJ/RimL family protein N-acetyltransferase
VNQTAPFERITWPVRTERLTLRPVTRADFPRLYEIRAHPGVSHWLGQAPTSYEAYLARNDDPKRIASTLVVEHGVEHGGEIIGDLFLAVESAWSQVEVQEQAADSLGVLGWCVHPRYAGQGLATEAATELLRLLFEELGVRRVVAGAFADNVASVRVMEKIGMRLEIRGVRDQLHRDLGWLDGVGYALLAEEWRAMRNGHDDARLRP